jgi:excisionase family DNA binding protein
VTGGDRQKRLRGGLTLAPTPSKDRLAPDECTMTSVNPLLLSGTDRLVYSVTEAGQLLGISRAFAYELAARGEIPVIRFGRRTVIPRALLLELLNIPMTEGAV